MRVVALCFLALVAASVGEARGKLAKYFGDQQGRSQPSIYCVMSVLPPKSA